MATQSPKKTNYMQESFLGRHTQFKIKCRVVCRFVDKFQIIMTRFWLKMLVQLSEFNM